MADQIKITGLSADTSPLNTDVYPLVDTTDHTQAPSGTTKKMTRVNFFSNLPTMTFATASALRTGTTATNTYLMQAYDVDGAAYSTFGTFTAANTPSLAFAQPVGGALSWVDGTLDNAILGGSTRAAAYVSTLAVNTNTNTVLSLTSFDNVVVDTATGIARTNSSIFNGGNSPVREIHLRARGTPASPLAVQDTDPIYTFRTHGYDGTNFIRNYEIDINTDGTVGSNQVPVSVTHFILKNGDTTLTQVMKFQNDGSTLISLFDNALFKTGSAIRSNTTAANTLLLQGYDVDGVAYKTFATLTSANTPSLAFLQPSGGLLSWDGGIIGGSIPAAITGTIITANTSFKSDLHSQLGAASAVVFTNTGSNNAIDSVILSSSSGGITVTPAIGFAIRLNGGIFNTRRTLISNITLNVTIDDYYLFINKTIGAATSVVLPDATTVGGSTFIIKDAKGDAFTNNITITTGGGNIDGLSSYVMNVNYQSLTVTSNGTNYLIV